MATTKEKPKEQPGVMHVYKMNTGAGGMTPESRVVTKKMVSSWGMLRRSKAYRENEHDQLKPGKIFNNVVVSEGRKSVSVLEARKSSVAATINEGRKSVSSKAEGINVGTVAAFMKVKVLVTDMPGFMQVHAFRRARQSYDSLDKFSSKNMACDMKKEFDKVYGPAWHCIVGSSFGSFVTHSTGCFLYFTMEKLYVLVFKTKVQKALEA